eukprot:gene16896-23172_t
MSTIIAKSNPASKLFRGDDDVLVDQLISASMEHKTVPDVPLPGFGRDLQPYFAEGEFVPPPSPVVRKSSKDSCKNSSRSTSPKAQPMPASKGSMNMKTLAPNSASGAARPYNKPSKLDQNCATRRGTSPKKNAYNAPIDLSSQPACPGMFSSPNPRELPKPSMTLFKRATQIELSAVPILGNQFAAPSMILVRA